LFPFGDYQGISSIKNGGIEPPFFAFVRPAGRTYLEVKVLYSPDKGKS